VKYCLSTDKPTDMTRVRNILTLHRAN